MSSEVGGVQVGDIVLAPFLFADASVTKLRPAVLISQLPDDVWLVAYVTSTVPKTDYDVVLKMAAHNNLKVDSTVRVNRMTVISESLIQRTLGHVTKSEQKKIAAKITNISSTFAT